MNLDRIVKMDERKGVKRKLDVKSMDIKYRAVMEVERGLKSKAKIAEEFGVKRNTLSTWIKNNSQLSMGIVVVRSMWIERKCVMLSLRT